MTNLQEPTEVRLRLASGRWVTERAYAEAHALSMQTLANWRYRDRMSGRPGALPGYPQYRRFGRAIRYWIESEQNDGAAA